MRARTLEASFRSAGCIVTLTEIGVGDTVATIVAGTIFTGPTALCSWLETELAPTLARATLESGRVTLVIDGAHGQCTLTISEAAAQTYMGITGIVAGDGWVDEYQGSVCPGWWSGYVRRDWQYEYGSEYSAINTHQGGQRTPGRVRSGDIVLWASVAALTEIEQLYRCLYYALDRRTITDDLSRTFVIGDAGRIEAVPQSHPMTYLRLPLVMVES